MAFTITHVFVSTVLSILFCVSLSLKPPPRALVLPITKDPTTKQYIAQIKQRTPFVPVKLTVDLGGESSWVDCSKGYSSTTYKPVHCLSSLCRKTLKSTFSCGECYPGLPMPRCAPDNRPCPVFPGCSNNTCSVFLENSVIKNIVSGEVAKDIVSIQTSSDGRNPGPSISIQDLIFSCAETYMLKGLAKGVKGMAGLGKNAIGLPSQFSQAYRFPRKFAMCLSSSSSSSSSSGGVIFFGNGPYIVLPGIDVSQGLTYTPLLTNPIGVPWTDNVPGNDPSGEYFIGVTGIDVDGKPVSLNKTLLQINKEGFGGTKISTVVPYMTMETSIYNAVTDAFISSLSNVPRVKPVAPFKACYRASSLGSTRVGLAGPPVTLILQNGSSWTFFGANAFVSVKDGTVACLGIVDGGVDQVTSIVIGGHQLENAILEFDLERSSLGFTASLLGSRTSCNFNYTSKA